MKQAKSYIDQLADANEIIRQKNAKLLLVERELRRLRGPSRDVTTPELIQLQKKLPKAVGRLRLASQTMVGSRVHLFYEVVV